MDVRGKPRGHGREGAAISTLLAVAITDFIQRLVFIYPVSHAGQRGKWWRRRGSSVVISVTEQCGVDLA
jgi:hypothetical protein